MTADSVHPLESAFRLALLEALSEAAEDITRELAPGSVDVRLRGRDPAFIVTPAPEEPIVTIPDAVNNGLDSADGPADGDETLHVHVRTGSGDIAVRRSTADSASRA